MAANISSLLNTIKTAIYGTDMRNAIHDSINSINDALEAHEETYGTGSDYGHIKLSGANSSYGTSSHYAATPASVATVASNLSTEISDRQSADTALQTNINTEANTRASADAALQANIEAEATNRENADGILQNNIDALEKTTEATITQLQADAETTHSSIMDSISDEISMRHSTDEELQTQIDALAEMSKDLNRFNKYKEYADLALAGLLVENQNIYFAIGVVSYDGGLFTQAQLGENLDGGAFIDSDDDLEECDCGDFEPITASVATGSTDTVDGGEFDSVSTGAIDGGTY